MVKKFALTGALVVALGASGAAPAQAGFTFHWKAKILHLLENGYEPDQVCRELYAYVSRWDMLEAALNDLDQNVVDPNDAEDEVYNVGWQYRARMARLNGHGRNMYFIKKCERLVNHILAMHSPTQPDHNW